MNVINMSIFQGILVPKLKFSIFLTLSVINGPSPSFGTLISPALNVGGWVGVGFM